MQATSKEDHDQALQLLLKKRADENARGGAIDDATANGVI